MTDFTSRDGTLASRGADLTLNTPAEDARTDLLNRVNWGAIFAGALIALIIQFLLSLLGAGIGAATLNPGSGDNPDVATFSMMSAIWYAISGIVAAFAGGFVAARMSGRSTASNGGLHGLTSWALTMLVLLYLLTTAIGGLVGGALSGLGAVAGGLGTSVAAVAQTSDLADPLTAIQDQISSMGGSTDPTAMQETAISAVRAALTGGEAQGEQARETAAQALSRAQGIPLEQARTQLESYQQQYAAAMQNIQTQAIQAADAAATATATGAIAAFFALLLGAIAAWFGGFLGVAKPIHTIAPIGLRRS